MKPHFLRIVFLSTMGVLLMWAYLYSNHREIESPEIVTMPGWVPFWPVLAIPYLGLLWVSWFLPLAIREKGRFAACMRAYLWGFLMVFSLWVFYPTEMARPVYSEGWWNLPYAWLVAVDRSANILPCGHILPPVFVCWFLAEERRRWLWWMVPMLVGGTIAIVTTWQHRPVDVAIGAGIAMVATALGKWVWWGRQAP